jgi:hypothetical protein
VNNEFTEWQVNTEYVTTIPSLSDVKSTCYKLLSDNIKGGLGYYIKDSWSSIDKYRDGMAIMGLSREFIPATPEELTDILTKYVVDQFTKGYIIFNEGNEWQNPEAAGLEKQLKNSVEKMLRDRAKTVGIDDIRTGLLVTFFNTLYTLRIEPGLKSMLTDVNQYSDLDGRLKSRTDDLNAVLRLKR